VRCPFVIYWVMVTSEPAWNCPVCAHDTRYKLTAQREFAIRECGACGHQFAALQPSDQHVSAVYGDDYFFGGGAGYPDYLREGELLRARGARYAKLIRTWVEPGAMLDAGAACGFVCDGFRSAGWQAEGLEPNETMARYGREHLNLPIHTGTLESFSGERQYDLIGMIQVIAHFADLRRAMQRAAALTRAGGFWLIETWNSRSLTARVFGKHWHEYNPPSVLHYFTRHSLALLAGRFGFQRVAGGWPRKDIQWRHARSVLEHQTSWKWFRRASRLIPDDTTLPYPAEDLFWVLLRKCA